MSSSEKQSPPVVQEAGQKETPAPTTERPPQEGELLCTICGMSSCWRDAR